MRRLYLFKKVSIGGSKLVLIVILEIDRLLLTFDLRVKSSLGEKEKKKKKSLTQLSNIVHRIIEDMYLCMFEQTNRKDLKR
jgi:Cdc6-like AAA superfamily ATPase